ncbi:hypothetical protein TNCV_2457571 [Trichonephila clavipes]|nr:hypothetical protein TNCV_2457571 [Trichonephila clavipes]
MLSSKEVIKCCQGTNFLRKSQNREWYCISYISYVACLAHGLLEGDNAWCDTLTDASICSSASKLRELFAIILVFCNVSNPPELWNKFKDHFMEDYVRDFQRHYPDADINAQLENFSNRFRFALQRRSSFHRRQYSPSLWFTISTSDRWNC